VVWITAARSGNNWTATGWADIEAVDGEISAAVFPGAATDVSERVFVPAEHRTT